MNVIYLCVLLAGSYSLEYWISASYVLVRGEASAVLIDVKNRCTYQFDGEMRQTGYFPTIINKADSLENMVLVDGNSQFKGVQSRTYESAVQKMKEIIVVNDNSFKSNRNIYGVPPDLASFFQGLPANARNSIPHIEDEDGLILPLLHSTILVHEEGHKTSETVIFEFQEMSAIVVDSIFFKPYIQAASSNSTESGE